MTHFPEMRRTTMQQNQINGMEHPPSLKLENMNKYSSSVSPNEGMPSMKQVHTFRAMRHDI